VAPSVGVRVSQRCALVGASVVHSWANRGKCGGEVVEGPCERCTRVSDGNGDEFHQSPMLLEGRDEGVVLLGLLRVFLVSVCLGVVVSGKRSLHDISWVLRDIGVPSDASGLNG